MTIICVALTPKNLEFKTNFNIAEQLIEQCIIMEGKPQIQGTYLHTKLKLVKEGKEINIPELASYRIIPSKKSSKIKGKIFYFEKQSDWELGDRAECFYTELKIGIESFNNLVKIAQCSKSNISVIASFVCQTSNDVLKTDITGHEVIWNIDCSHELELESFMFNSEIITS